MSAGRHSQLTYVGISGDDKVGISTKINIRDVLNT